MFRLLRKTVPLTTTVLSSGSRERHQDARVRLDRFHDDCSAVYTWWHQQPLCHPHPSPVCTSAAVPRRRQHLGGPRSHSGTVSAVLTYTVHLGSKPQRSSNPGVVPGTKSTPRDQGIYVLLFPNFKGQTAEILLLHCSSKAKQELHEDYHIRQRFPKTIAIKLCITFILKNRMESSKSLTRGPSISGIWQVRNTC